MRRTRHRQTEHGAATRESVPTANLLDGETKRYGPNQRAPARKSRRNSTGGNNAQRYGRGAYFRSIPSETDLVEIDLCPDTIRIVSNASDSYVGSGTGNGLRVHRRWEDRLFTGAFRRSTSRVISAGSALRWNFSGVSFRGQGSHV